MTTINNIYSRFKLKAGFKSRINNISFVLTVKQPFQKNRAEHQRFLTLRPFEYPAIILRAKLWLENKQRMPNLQKSDRNIILTGLVLLKTFLPLIEHMVSLHMPRTVGWYEKRV